MLRNKFFSFGERLIEKGAWYLAPLSLLYAAAITLRNFLYDAGWLPITHVKPVVVSVGNIVAGGSGKTPLVHLLAKTFAHRRVAILSRGYGPMPDEALLLARRLPEARVVIGKDRSALARLIGADLILLDDGFQHRKLHRDFDIVIGEQTGHFLPWGRLRDSPRRLRKTEWVFPPQAFSLAVRRILDRHQREIPTIRGWKVALFCAIAKPHRFRKTVEALGAEVISETHFADHEVPDLSRLPQAKAFLCTEKDFVKLPPTDLPIYYLEMETEVVHEKEKWQKLIEKIDQKIDNRRTL
jgi:tetraacyldisaccharide 4'-kinase